jgi:hypothetical protein
VPPAGAKVIARSSRAVVTSENGPPTGNDEVFPATAVMGCLTANGRERLLDTSTFNTFDGATDYPMAALGGTYAGVVARGYVEHYNLGDADTVEVFDLRTGARAGFGGESGFCEPYSTSSICGIDKLVVGQNGVSAAHVDSGEPEDLVNVTCPSAALCVAHNQFGDVSASIDPPHGRWSSGKLAVLWSVSCPSTVLCVGVGGATPFLYVSTNPSGGPSTWTKTQIPGVQSIEDVSCPSTTLCVASTSSGQLLVSTDPTSGPSAWSVDSVDGTATLGAISCPTTSACFVAAHITGGEDLITTSNPTGGAGAWSVRHIGLGVLEQLSCPSSSLCVAVASGGLLVSTDPAAGPWTPTNSSFRATDVSCPSTSLCVAVNDSAVSVSTDPSSGQWTTYGLNEHPRNVSCPTTTFCAIGTSGTGYALTSPDPLAGSTAWKPVLADPIDCITNAAPCATENIIASDRTGVHTLGSSTEYEDQTGRQLTGLSLSGDTLTWNAHGSAISARLTP